MNITLLKYMFFRGCWLIRAGWLELAIQVRPPTSDDRNFFVRTPFQVFLDSMEIPLSQDSIYRTVEDSG